MLPWSGAWHLVMILFPLHGPCASGSYVHRAAVPFFYHTCQSFLPWLVAGAVGHFRVVQCMESGKEI